MADKSAFVQLPTNMPLASAPDNDDYFGAKSAPEPAAVPAAPPAPVAAAPPPPAPKPVAAAPPPRQQPVAQPRTAPAQPARQPQQQQYQYDQGGVEEEYVGRRQGMFARLFGGSNQKKSQPQPNQKKNSSVYEMNRR